MKTSNYFRPGFIEKLMQDHQPENEIKVQSVGQFHVDNSASILSTLNAGSTGLEIGHFGLEVNFTKNKKNCSRRMVMKVKPHGDVTSTMLLGLAQMNGEPLTSVYKPFAKLTGFQNTHIRELEVYKKLGMPLQPEIFGLMEDRQNNIFLVLMEALEEVELLNSVMQPEKWTEEYIKESLSAIASWHASNMEAPKSLNKQYWNEDVPSKEYMLKLQPLWRGLLDNAVENLPKIYTPENTQRLRWAIENISEYWDLLEKQPKTLIHNDFNPRNMCFKSLENPPKLCLYDWELATFHVPHYDVVEFLSFVLPPQHYHLRTGYIEFYRQELNRLTGNYGNEQLFKKVFYYAALDFGLHRFGMYMMAHSISPYPFLPRVIHSYFDTLKQLSLITGNLGS
ncbi:aminoglycoside phosphotransferase family protein [Gramella sp. AN32]|uniref:Aminoglycoside phosphotransferase family protein n=1 Tax=Christiangramia antarctica TaxID=2058158 RepID=A0ABW5X731_9FLAO|nr:aminoglycoside phosphotransferase family protein [Gramella sp. AN32]